MNKNNPTANAIKPGFPFPEILPPELYLKVILSTAKMLITFNIKTISNFRNITATQLPKDQNLIHMVLLYNNKEVPLMLFLSISSRRTSVRYYSFLIT